jgi:DNA-directed RNA polymerase
MEMYIRRPTEELSKTYGDKQLAQQIIMEERMVLMGRDQIRKKIATAREKGAEGSTSYGKFLIASSVDQVAEAIRAFIGRANSGRAGRRHAAVKYIEQVDPEVAGYIAMRTIVDTLTGQKKLLQRVAVTIGSRIEDEVRFAAFEESYRKRYERALEKAKKGTNYHRKKHTMAGFERRAADDADADQWAAWPEQDRLHLGMTLIDMVRESGLIEIANDVRSRQDTTKVIQPTEQLIQWIEKQSERSELLHPAHLPMTVRPLPWTTPFSGGYLTRQAQGRISMVKTGNVNYLQEMADRAEEMPMVYESLNALQDTAWRINPAVHAAAAAVWDRADEADSVMPSREDTGFVPCPACGAAVELPKTNTRGSVEHGCFANEDVLRRWKKAAHEAHDGNVSRRSKRLVTAKTLRVADTMSEFEAIYFPYQLDFRGRIYAIPSFNPQGADMTKGLLEFAEAKPIEDAVAAGWLAIHGANVYGFDKASLEDRIGWIEDHEEAIIQSADDPSSTSFWMRADKPWQFLAFCFEWAGFCRQGFGFMSRLPVALDGTCSGIQHFSAMLRDEEGGRAVNLIAGETPEDIYQRVCDKAVKVLVEDSAELSATIAIVENQRSKKYGEDVGENEAIGETNAITFAIPEDTQKEDVTEAQFAMGWLSLQPNRKTTKRQVMTLPYGSTMFSCRGYTEQWMLERIAETGRRPWPKHLDFAASQYMSKIIWHSIGEVVVAARDAMDWLQSCAKVVAKEGLPVYWQTPSGFPVMQRYNDFNQRRVKTKLGDTVIKLSLQEEQHDKINSRKMANSISPNFVHSMDATHLVWSVCYGLNNGVQSFAMVHDSFGTHAADTEMLAACLRSSFVDLYERHDVLDEFREQIKRQVDPGNRAQIKPIPAKGNLNIQGVQQSDFFFA